MTLPFFFARPFSLLLWLPLGAAARLLLRSRAVHHRRAVILRLLAIALAVLALGGPTLRRPEPSSARIYLADLSDSVTPAVRDAIATWIHHELEKVADDEQHPAAIIAFGSQAVVERPLLPANRIRWSGFQSRPEAGGTDLSSALALAAALVPADQPSRLVLISDGAETTGSALLAAAELRRRGIPVDVLPLPASTGEETGLSGLRIPSSARRGEALRATISIWHTGSPARVPLRVELAGKEIFSRTVEVLPGQNTIHIPVTFTEPGLSSVRATIMPSRDTLSENNRTEAAVLVRDQPRVLVVSGHASGTDDDGKRLAYILADKGIAADFVSPLELPAQVSDYAAYAGVVLDNLPAYLLNNAQLAALQQFVTRLGGGLVVLGGPNSFGPGGYFGTPLEEVLPVYSELPERVYAPNLTLLLLLDQSGSMGAVVGEGSTKTKLEIAQQAALGAITLLNPADLVGVLAFESTPTWVVPLQRAENQSLIARQISRLESGGGTAIAPALEEAIRVMEGVNSAVKHVILLTDGHAEGDVFTAQVNRLRRTGATLSTVAVGRDADRELLQKLAAAGAGRYYYTDDPNEVPRIFATETATVTTELRIDRQFTPREVRAAPFIRSLIPTGELPSLGGYTITTPKPEATVYYTVPPGDEPLLAEGRYGLGKSIVFTSGLAGSWGENWRRWPLLGEFLAQLILETLPASEGSGLNLRLELNGDRAVLTLEALNPDGTYRHFLTPTATLLTPDGKSHEATLTEIGPGLYQADFPASAPGRYLAHVTVGEERAMAVAVQAYSPEYRHTGPNLALLFELAAITGGRMLTFSDSAWNVPAPGAAGNLPLSPLILALATCLFLADLSARYLTPAARARLGQTVARITAPATRLLTRLLPGLPQLGTGHQLKPDETAGEQDPTAELLRQRLTELGRHPTSRWRLTDLPPENGPENRSPSERAPASGDDSSRAARLYLARRRRQRQGF